MVEQANAENSENLSNDSPAKKRSLQVVKNSISEYEELFKDRFHPMRDKEYAEHVHLIENKVTMHPPVVDLRNHQVYFGSEYVVPKK